MTRRFVRIATLFLFLAATCLVGPRPVAAADPVLVGAGDISDCGSAKDEATATLLDGIPGTVATFGDNAYPTGSAAEFRDCYDPTWGRHKARTRPSAGNHEYETAGARRLLRLLRGRRRARREGLVQLRPRALAHRRAELELRRRRRCGPDSAQVTWLRADLAAHAGDHVIAYWHHPRFSSGEHGTDDVGAGRSGRPCTPPAPTSSSTATTTTTSASRPRTPAGAPTPPTGSASSSSGPAARRCGPAAPTAANSEVFSSTFGVLKLTLHADSYDWRFVPIAGESFTRLGHGHAARPADEVVQADRRRWVDQRHPRTNHGASPRLYVDGDAGRGRDLRSYVKFKVTGVTGTVDRAVLRLWVTNGTSNGPTVGADLDELVRRQADVAEPPRPDGAGRRRRRGARRRPVGRLRRDRPGARQRHLRVPASLHLGRWARGLVGERRAPPAAGHPVRRPLTGRSYR